MKIYKRLATAALMLLFLLPAGSAFAADELATPNENVRVGFFVFDGYHNIGTDGVRSGYGYEFLQMASQYIDIKYTYIGYNKNWSEMQEMLENGEIDLLTSAQKTSEREQYFDFSDKPIGTSATILTIKSGNRKIVAGDYASYDGMRVGMQKDSTRNDSFASFAEKHDFSYTPVYFDSTAEMESALQENNGILSPLHIPSFSPQTTSFSPTRAVLLCCSSRTASGP